MGSQDQKHEQRKSQQTAVRKTARASENLRLVKKKKKEKVQQGLCKMYSTGSVPKAPNTY